LDFDMDDLPEGVTTKSEEEPAEVYVPPAGAEEFRYEAEVSRMLDIVVNSLYQNKDVFLRELISNASDALDKIRYLLLTQPDAYGSTYNDVPLEVKISFDEIAKTLTIQDTGVGMTKEDMVKNLGTVARSGTTKFLESMKETGSSKEAISQIGQFGVGFYSAFLVANRVTVASKSPLDPVQHIWESTNGASEFHVYEDPRGNSLQRGTEITLHLKSDATEYANDYKLKKLAGHYSEFVTYPISLRTTTTTEVEIEDDETDKAAADGDDAAAKKADDEDLEVKDDEEDEEKPKKKTKEVTTHSWDVINGNPAIWTRDKDEITDDEYQSFWEVLSSDSSNATAWSHFNAEGNINFKSILYLPSEIPMSYRYGNMDPVDGAMRLYVRKVLIGDKFELLPKYLGFIRGVVDSDDMPLNVNRETLQESKVLRVIQKKLVRKAIDMIRQLAKEEEDAVAEKETEGEKDSDDDDEKPKKASTKYIDWYRKFSTNLKLGVLEDYGNQSKLMKLLRFETSKSAGKMISFPDYVKGMKEWQKAIYVLGCSSAEECKQSRFLEPFIEKDVEVMFMTEAIDEYMMRNVRDFDKKKLVQISSENVKFDDEDADLVKRRETKALKKLYKNTVTRVQVAKRSLGSVPAIVSSADFGNSANMERVMRAQAFQQGADPMQIQAMKIFELNPRHPLVTKLLAGVPEDDDAALPQETIDAAWMLHDMAMLNGGFPIVDPDAHNKRLLKIMTSQLGVESLDLQPEIHPPVEEEAAGGGSDDGEIDMDAFDMNNIDIEALKEKYGAGGGDEL
jgi:heat shock protein 90kDa beta